MNGLLITKISFSDTHLQAHLNDNRIISTPLSWYPKLMELPAEKRQNYSLIAKGRGVEWEEIDYYLSLSGMLAGRMENSSRKRIA